MTTESLYRNVRTGSVGWLNEDQVLSLPGTFELVTGECEDDKCVVEPLVETPLEAETILTEPFTPDTSRAKAPKTASKEK